MSSDNIDDKASEHQEIDLDEESFDQHLDSAIEETSQALLKHDDSDTDSHDLDRTQSWESAGKLVRDFRPVPWIIWRIMRMAYGKDVVNTNVSAGAFITVDRLMIKAACDPTLGGEATFESDVPTLSESVAALGGDVAAAVCYVHALCRRIGQNLSELIWRPLLDDALIRAKIGYYVGQISTEITPGQGMLAGFSGRSGLAILVANGTAEQAQQALMMMAQGTDIRDVGLIVYGCEPLQVSSLALAAAGCNRDAAFGTASYGISMEQSRVEPGSASYLWLAAFMVTENLRMGTASKVTNDIWEVLGMNRSASMRDELQMKSRLVQRRGHGWQWIAQGLQAEEPEKDEAEQEGVAPEAGE